MVTTGKRFPFRTVWPLLLLGLMLFAGCGQEPALDLPALENAARAGDARAVSQLVSLLGRRENGVNDRVYPVVVALGREAVPALSGQLDTSDPVLREYTIAALGTLRAKEAVDGIRATLKDRAFGRRYIAAWALGQIGDPATIPALIEALDDANETVRRYATRALIRFDRKAVPPLVQALPAATSRAAGYIIRALGDIGDPRAVDSLLRAVDGPNRGLAFQALGKLKERRAEQALIDGLNDSDWRTRMQAAMALGPLGGPAAAEALQPLLDDPEVVVREWAARSLEMITGRHVRYRDARGELVMPYNIYH
ncbi:HEAT repeat protein [Geothermobacter ehrlichii]|uniref:HEAT repeat protein n=1 Tax=Geothermobacter ehrlichii TaxID=213224 RepID=A0A5D3WII1_9BACT|nr:HEAT repeat domain-containing protein [Geothermobacter ehrlichii]TYO97126.1 HEAT repeat protein [Geothermobacter ehrlichii]